MELSVHGGHVGNLDKWALLQMSRQERVLRKERSEQTQESLSKLLFGVDLSPDELRLYKARLLDVISKVDALESGLQIPFKDDLAIPKNKLMYQVGNLGWLPGKSETPLIANTPSQEIHSRNLARNLQLLYSLNPKSVHQSFHTVGIVVGRAGEGTRWGEDKVELSQWALNVVHQGDYPKVASLRLPPRFPTQVEMVQLCVS